MDSDVVDLSMQGRREISVCDGPMGTQLNLRGVETPGPMWSAAAIETAPHVIASIHRDYVEAGATVHTTATFRTKRRTAGQRWKTLTRLAVDIAKSSVPPDHQIAGSLSPLEDCYRPDLSPRDCRREHDEMAHELAECGCDLILCETFPNPDEAIVALQAALGTGLPTWLALTAGPSGDLMSVGEMVVVARQSEQLGTEAVLVNCTPASITQRFIQALTASGLQIRIGAYANAGHTQEGIGWETDGPDAVEKYLAFASQWKSAGATILGGCCGTGPKHIRAIAQRLQ